MKLVKKINTFAAIIGILSAFLLPLFVATPVTVYAAGCPASANSDSQVTSQQNCINRYQEDCKQKGFSGSFCESLRIADVNRCAADKAYTLTKSCLQSLSKYTAESRNCYANYNGKSSPGDLNLNDYSNSGCDKEDGGSCDLSNRVQASTVSCTRVSADNNSSDSSQESESNIGEDRNENDCKTKGNEELSSDNCEVVEMIVLITNALSGLAATIIVAMIIVGGIQYSMAGSEAAKVQAAKQKITNALLALLLLIFGFSIIQWLIPGGLI